MNTIDLLKQMGVPSTLITGDVVSFTEKIEKIVQLYAKKNKDYGNAFHYSFNKRGPVAMLSRLDEKMYRLDTIVKNGETAVEDETVMDTLLDIAAYAIMGAVEIAKWVGESTQVEEHDTV